MKHSRILIGAVLSSALLAACGGNNAVPSTGSFGPPAGSLVPPGMVNPPMWQGAGHNSRPPQSSISRIAPDQTAPDRDDGHLILFDDPDAGGNAGSVCTGNPYCGTTPQANNDADTVVGYYTDSNYAVHGFIRWSSGQMSSGHIKNFDAPGAAPAAGQGTIPRSINRHGWIAGQYQDSNGVYHGFVRKRDGSFLLPYDDQYAGTGAGQGTQTFDINEHGETAGNYIDSSGAQHGWVCSPKVVCKNFNPPASSWAFMLVCEQTCMNSSGTVVGFYIGSNYQEHGFVRYPDGTIENIDVKGAGKGQFQGTGVQSINNRGDIAGVITDSHDFQHGFILMHEVKRTRSLITFDVPGSKPVNQPCAHGTELFSINDYDATTGIFPNSVATVVGFERFRSGHFSTFEAGGGTGQCQGTFPSTNNNRNDVTGWFTDSTGLNHGFVWTPDESLRQ